MRTPTSVPCEIFGKHTSLVDPRMGHLSNRPTAAAVNASARLWVTEHPRRFCAQKTCRGAAAVAPMDFPGLSMDFPAASRLALSSHGRSVVPSRARKRVKNASTQLAFVHGE
jgi:hypothetical protein